MCAILSSDLSSSSAEVLRRCRLFDGLEDFTVLIASSQMAQHLHANGVCNGWIWIFSFIRF